jgi:carbon storage regulator CsrA
MLILTRRTGETIRIGNEIQVTVFGVNGNQVRIGIEAPKSINIVREELVARALIDRRENPLRHDE